MVRRKVRADDDGNNEGYKQRAVLDAKTIILVISFLLGGGLGNVGINQFTGNDHISELNSIDNRLQAVEINFGNYKESQAHEQALRNINLETKLTAIQSSIKDLKDLLNQMRKDGISNGKK